MLALQAGWQEKRSVKEMPFATKPECNEQKAKERWWIPRITREVSSLEFIGVRYVWCELNFWIPGFTHSSAGIPE